MTDEEKKTIEKLLFIDANIWLDFYRANKDAGLKLLKRVEEVKDHLIVTYLLEVEFKRNRQTVLKDSWGKLKAPEQFGVPNIVADENTSTARSGDGVPFGHCLRLRQCPAARAVTWIVT
jgi:hypothetical protein